MYVFDGEPVDFLPGNVSLSGHFFDGWFTRYKDADGDFHYSTKITYGEGGGSDKPVGVVVEGNWKLITNLIVPSRETTYYALYVPYVSGSVQLSHGKSLTSAGIAYELYIAAAYDNQNPNARTRNPEEGSDTLIPRIRDAEIALTLNERALDAETIPTVSITLKARANYGSTYHQTYRENHYYGRGDYNAEDDLWITSPNNPANRDLKHLFSHTSELSLAEFFADSETVKGLKTLKPIHFYSDFARRYEIDYKFNQRNGTERHYLVQGEVYDITSEDDFRRMIINKAPYESNWGEKLAWNGASIRIVNLDGYGMICGYMDAVKYNIDLAKVIVMEDNGLAVTLTVPVGEAFSEEARPKVDDKDLLIEKDGQRQQFSHWEICRAVNQDGKIQKGELVGRCYYKEFFRC